MSNKKKLNSAAVSLLKSHGKHIAQACLDKSMMPNRFGKRQHTVINPMRQVRKMLKRELSLG